MSIVAISIFVLMAMGGVFHGPAPDEPAPAEPDEDQSEDEQFYRPYHDVLSLNHM